jgi:hypothetical protein
MSERPWMKTAHDNKFLATDGGRNTAIDQDRLIFLVPSTNEPNYRELALVGAFLLAFYLIAKKK